MKETIAIILTFITFNYCTATKDSLSIKRHFNIEIDLPFPLLLNIVALKNSNYPSTKAFYISVEKFLKKKYSFELNYMYLWDSPKKGTNKDQIVKDHIIIPEFNYYLKNNNCNGVYFGTGLILAYIYNNYRTGYYYHTEITKRIELGIIFTAGYQICLNNLILDFSINPCFGKTIFYQNNLNKKNPHDKVYLGIIPNIFSIGVSF